MPTQKKKKNKHAERVTELILRGIFMLRESELRFYYQVRRLPACVDDLCDIIQKGGCPGAERNKKGGPSRRSAD